MKKVSLILALLLICAFAVAFADIPTKPAKFDFILDYANIVKASDEGLIRLYCAEVLKLGYSQVTVLTIDSFDGMDSEQYGADVINTWGLGGDSVLVLLATIDREVCICTGRYIDRAISSDICDEILDKNIMYLATNDYSTGLREIAKDICLRIISIYSPLFEDVGIVRN